MSLKLLSPTVDARTQRALNRWMTPKPQPIDSRTSQDDGSGLFRGMVSTLAIYVALALLWALLRAIPIAYLIYAAGWITVGITLSVRLRQRRASRGR